MAKRAKGRVNRRLVRLERLLVQSLMVPIVVIADRRIARALKRSA